MKPKEAEPDKWKQNKPKGNFIFSRKYDGARYIKTKNGLWSKRNCNRKNRFKQIWKELKQIPATLDTEIYIPNGSVLDLNAKKNWKDAKAVIFDLLSYKETDYRNKELHERQEKLQEITEKHQLTHTHTPKTYTTFTEAWKQVKNKDLEGLVAKDINSKYHAGRSDKWIKLKRRLNTDVEITGHEEGKDTGTFYCQTDEGKEIRVNVRSRQMLEKWREGNYTKAEVNYQFKTKEGKLFQPTISKLIGGE